jgi:hypothetical protein
MNMREHTNAEGGQILLKFQYIKAGGKHSNQWFLKDYLFCSPYLHNINDGHVSNSDSGNDKRSQ